MVEQELSLSAPDGCLATSHANGSQKTLFMVTHHEQENGIVVTFSGNLDTETSIGLEPDLYALIRENKSSVVFDLQHVNMISSIFLRTCIKVLKQAGKDNLSIVHATNQVMKVFRMTRLDKLLNVSQ